MDRPVDTSCECRAAERGALAVWGRCKCVVTKLCDMRRGCAWVCRVCVGVQEAGSFSDLQQQVHMQASSLKKLAGSNRKLAVAADAAAASGGGAAASVLARLASVEAWSFDVRLLLRPRLGHIRTPTCTPTQSYFARVPDQCEDRTLVFVLF